MEKASEIKKMSVSERLTNGEKLGAKVAKIMNKARAQANKILVDEGYEVNISVDFVKTLKPEDEVSNG